MATAQETTAAVPESAMSRVNDLLNQFVQNEATKQQLKEQTVGIDKNQADLKGELLNWAKAYPAAFGGGKTLALKAGTIGFKKEGERIVWDAEATPKDYEAKLLKIVQADYPDAVEPKVDPKKLLKAWHVLADLRKKLAKLGASVRNADVFTITVNKRKTDE